DMEVSGQREGRQRLTRRGVPSRQLVPPRGAEDPPVGCLPCGVQMVGIRRRRQPANVCAGGGVVDVYRKAELDKDMTRIARYAHWPGGIQMLPVLLGDAAHERP